MNSSFSISLLFSIIIILFSGCTTPEKTATLKPGMWRATINVQGSDLPFNFEVRHEKGLEIYLQNGEERIQLDEVRIEKDSFYIPMHIFDADLKGTIKNNRLQGRWTKNYAEDYSLDFTATYGQSHRFEPTELKPQDFNGKWRVTFIHADDQDTTEAVGIFGQTGTAITGTFLTPTGDYRYLEGTAYGKELKLSTFDGGHAFLFSARLNAQNELVGDFWSGKRWHETWSAVRDEAAALPDPDSLTYIKEGHDGLTFSFPDLEGKMVSLDDYKGKVVILDIFGTWCPNCMDETKFLKKWYDDNRHRGVEVLGLAYEAKDDYEYAKSRVEHMKNKWDIQYNMLIAGTLDKKEAAKTLPMLNHVLAFPTTIFIDKNGEVKRIHTGFTGPGTGHYYEQFIKEFNETVDELVAQN
ncbi:TlpA family protein disulfide reductase [Fulvivirga sp. M361]|uniref:peroxiredoxin family protein n=1 Tax=Fulvivirga sp. M361 TaxID=2594266 RepID=UPI00117A7B7D|nr:TlpA disulfide reductase family protein [Fulvivirga sp. M361]TRX54277.1 TlpA family protein disulfide reductase [Fulvivirga sp. M361]